MSGRYIVPSGDCGTIPYRQSIFDIQGAHAPLWPLIFSIPAMNRLWNDHSNIVVEAIELLKFGWVIMPFDGCDWTIVYPLFLSF